MFIIVKENYYKTNYKDFNWRFYECPFSDNIDKEVSFLWMAEGRCGYTKPRALFTPSASNSQALINLYLVFSKEETVLTTTYGV